MVAEVDSLVNDFVRVATLAGLPITGSEVGHKLLRAPHLQPALPHGLQAVYVFSLATAPFTVLKVGKAGPKSNARFQTQHYSPNSAGSNLARSLINHGDLWGQFGIRFLNEDAAGEWIRKHTDRDHFLLSARREAVYLALLEIFLQCRLHPVFEG